LQDSVSCDTGIRNRCKEFLYLLPSPSMLRPTLHTRFCPPFLYKAFSCSNEEAAGPVGWALYPQDDDDSEANNRTPSCWPPIAQGPLEQDWCKSTPAAFMSCVSSICSPVSGYAVAQLAEALRNKTEGRGFDSRWCQWNFSFRPYYGPGLDSASNRNEYQEYFLRGKGGWCVGLTNLPPSCADCLEIWGETSSWNPLGLSRPVMGLLYQYISIAHTTVLCVTAP
jgi:hypothetical protein